MLDNAVGIAQISLQWSVRCYAGYKDEIFRIEIMLVIYREHRLERAVVNGREKHCHLLAERVGTLTGLRIEILDAQ